MRNGAAGPSINETGERPVMTSDWLLSAGSVAIVLLAMANAGGRLGVLGPADKPFRKAIDGEDGNDYRARAQRIITYLTTNSALPPEAG
jgi:hypothetical protein